MVFKVLPVLEFRKKVCESRSAPDILSKDLQRSRALIAISDTRCNCRACKAYMLHVWNIWAQLLETR